MGGQWAGLDHGLWVGHGDCIHMRGKPVAYGWATGEISLMMLRPRAYGWAVLQNLGILASSMPEHFGWTRTF